MFCEDFFDQDSMEIANKLYAVIPKEFIDYGKIDIETPFYIPELSDDDFKKFKTNLYDLELSPLLRSKMITTITEGYRLGSIYQSQYAKGLLIELSRLMPLNIAMSFSYILIKNSKAKDTQYIDSFYQVFNELKTELSNFGCYGEEISPWISNYLWEMQKEYPRELLQYIINALRNFRINEVILNNWAMDSMLSRASSKYKPNILYWTIAPPSVIDLEQISSYAQFDEVIRFEDFLKYKQQNQRLKLIQCLKYFISRGKNVLCIANHSTIDSRKDIVNLAKSEGVRSVVYYYDMCWESVLSKINEQEEKIPLRSIERVWSVLIPPRSHEAEEVIVFSNTKSNNNVFIWDLNTEIDAKFSERVLH